MSTIPLSVRLGDRTITRLVDGLQIRRNVHGVAEVNFRFSHPLTAVVPAYERVYVFDGRTADSVAEARVEDPGRSVGADGQVWDMSAIGEQARARDRAAPLVYIDRDLSTWEREQLFRATSAQAGPSDLPTSEGTDCLLMQYPPGEPIDNSSTIVMVYRAMERAGMIVAGVEWTEVAGFTPANPDYRFRMYAKPPGSGAGTLIRDNAWSTTATSRQATTTIPTNTSRVEFAAPRVSGGATNVSADTIWAAFYDIAVKAARYNLDGTLDFLNASYTGGRNVYPHEVVTDLLVRLLTAYDTATAQIDTSSTYQIDQLAYPDGITAEQLLSELMTLEPSFYWQVGPSNPATGKASFVWRKWPTHIRYEASMVDGLDLPGADAERYNRVTVRWQDKRGRVQTTVRTRAVSELDAAGLIREPEPIDISDEIGSLTNAQRVGDQFLAEHAIPPVSGTLTVARRVYDRDRGAFVQPWEIEPGHLIRIRELADSPGDLGDGDRDGKSRFRVVGSTYETSDNTARLELDAPPRTDTNLLAAVVADRVRKR